MPGHLLPRLTGRRRSLVSEFDSMALIRHFPGVHATPGEIGTPAQKEVRVMTEAIRHAGGGESQLVAIPAAGRPRAGELAPFRGRTGGAEPGEPRLAGQDWASWLRSSVSSRSMRLEEGLLLAGRELVEGPRQRGAAGEPVPIRAAWAGTTWTIVRRRSAGSAPFDEARAVEVGEHAADGGQGQPEPGGQLADGDRAVEELLERGDMPRPEYSAGGGAPRAASAASPGSRRGTPASGAGTSRSAARPLRPP